MIYRGFEGIYPLDQYQDDKKTKNIVSKIEYNTVVVFECFFT